MHGIVIIEKYYGMLLVDVLSNPRQCSISISHLDIKQVLLFSLWSIESTYKCYIFNSHNTLNIIKKIDILVGTNEFIHELYCTWNLDHTNLYILRPKIDLCPFYDLSSSFYPLMIDQRHIQIHLPNNLETCGAKEKMS